MYSLVIHTYSENQRLTFSLSLTHSLAPPLKQGGKGNIIICHERKTRRATSIYDRVLVRFLSYLHPLRYGTKKKNKTKPFPRIVSIKAGAIMMLIFLSLRKRRRRANYFVKKNFSHLTVTQRTHFYKFNQFLSVLDQKFMYFQL